MSVTNLITLTKGKIARLFGGRRGFWVTWGLIVVVPLILVPLLRQVNIINPYYNDVLVRMCISIIMVASLNLINGFLGQFSIGHAGFMAIGAYVAAILTTKPEFARFLVGPEWFRFLTATLIGASVSGILAYIIGIPAFRVRGDYLAVLTVAFNMIIVNIFTNMEYVGGPRGLIGVMQYTTFTSVWLWLIVTVVVIRNLILSAHGRAIMSVRDNEVAAELGGVNTQKYKLMAFAVGSFFAGVGGAMIGHHVQFINPPMFNIFKSIDFLIMLYLGGVGSITGSIAGAVIWTLLQEVLRPLLAMVHLEVWRLVVGPILLILMMIWRSKGLLGGIELSFLMPKPANPANNAGRSTGPAQDAGRGTGPAQDAGRSTGEEEGADDVSGT
jgi:branched-chain amino acid transport system permease protein